MKVKVPYGKNAAKTAQKLLDAAEASDDFDKFAVETTSEDHFLVPEEVAEAAGLKYEADATDEPSTEDEPLVPAGSGIPDSADPETKSPEGTGEDANNADPDAAKAPSKNASRDDWVAYARQVGGEDVEADTKSKDEGGLSRDELAAKYGSKE